jgi:hypothetical protein
MAASKIEIKFDFDTKDVQLATDKTLSLAQQLRILKRELQSTKEGTVEFQLLSQKLGDTEDALAKTNAKSRDLLTSFQLIPGPIGEFAAKLNGGIALLKTFSSFTLKDLQFQLGETAADFKEIFTNIGKATGITKLYTMLNDGLAKSFVKVGIGEGAAAVGARAFAAALVATGIGALVVLLGVAVSALMDFADSSKEAESATASLNKEIEDQNQLLDLNAKDLQRRRKVMLAQMKADGASESEIRKFNISNAKKDADNAYEEAVKAEKQYNANIGKVNEEGVKALTKNLLDKQQKNKDANANYLELGYNTQAEVNKQEDAAAKEAQSKADARAKERLQREKQFRMEQADAAVQIEKDKENTNETILRQALEKQKALQNDGKKISVEVAKQQKDEINKIVAEELSKDVTARKEANDLKIAQAKEANQLILDNLEFALNESKFLYGDESAQTRKVIQETFDARKKAIDDEVALLQAKKMTTDGLTQEEMLSLQNLGLAQKQLTLEVQTEGQRQVQADRDKAQGLYEAKMEAAATDFELQQEILNAKVEQDRLFFESQLANENLTVEQRKAIEDSQTANKQANAEAQTAIDDAVFQNQQAILGATANSIAALGALVGQETVAGKALGIAQALINTWIGASEAVKAKSVLPSPFDVVAKVINVAAIVATGLKTVQAITSVKVPTGTGGGAGAAAAVDNGPKVGKPKGLAKGGVLQGPGSGTSDSIPAMLSNGESVINAASTSMFRPLLSTINEIGGGRRFASGGVAELAANPLSGVDLTSSNQPVKAYVVSQDMSNQMMFDRTQKSRSEL